LLACLIVDVARCPAKPTRSIKGGAEAHYKSGNAMSKHRRTVRIEKQAASPTSPSYQTLRIGWRATMWRVQSSRVPWTLTQTWWSTLTKLPPLGSKSR
jgi:hypothetical protein